MASNPNRILIAEDHYVSRHLLERNLTNWGFDVKTAENGVEAVDVLESSDPPPIAILDWMMPEMDGLEVCMRIRKQPDIPYVYLLLLTAKSQKEEVAAGLDAGADDYVIKPFARKIHDLEAALLEVNEMRALLPICMYCKSVRDDRDYWHQIDEYVHTHVGTEFSHGVCPNCAKKMKNEIARTGINSGRTATE